MNIPVPLENKINATSKANKAEQVINRDEIIELIKNSSKENITKVYKYIICLISTIPI